MPKIAGHDITDRQLLALHGLYRGLVKQGAVHSVYGVNVTQQLNTLADNGIIARTSYTYMIPFGSPGEAIIDATPDFVISEHL